MMQHHAADTSNYKLYKSEAREFSSQLCRLTKDKTAPVINNDNKQESPHNP